MRPHVIFESWCFIQAGHPAPRSAWAPAWFPARRTIYTRKSTRELPVVQRGDVFGIYYPRQNRIAHVGFIDGQQEGFFITVEGNTNANGSRNGDGVYRKRRSVRAIYKISRWQSGRTVGTILHPCRKPLDLVAQFVRDSTQPGDLVLDCFLGSGVTCEAAKSLGRQFIGFEINEKNYEVGKQQIASYQQDNTL